MIYRARHLEEMEIIAQQMASQFKKGDHILLAGELGVGKTTLVRLLVERWGLLPESSSVTSPTFTLIHEYKTKLGTVFHFDWYRLQEAKDLLALDLEDYFNEESICFVEWGDKFESMTHYFNKKIRFSIDAQHCRQLEISSQ